jgi:hypothetical protein
MSFIGQGLTGLVGYPDITALVTGQNFVADTDFYTADGSDVGDTGLWRLKGSNVTAGDSYRVTGTSAEYISTLTVTNDGHGSATGSGTVIDGVSQNIYATPSTNYKFTQWLGVTGTASFGSATGASTTVIVTGGDATVEATFDYITYSLTYTNDGNGSATGPVTVNSGQATPILAVPNTHYGFSQWLGITGAVSFSSPTGASSNVTATSDATIEATFKHDTYILTIANDGHGTTTPTGAYTVWSYTGIAISATGAVGYMFDHWSAAGDATIGSPTGAATTVTLTDSNDTVTANFSNDIFSLTVSNAGHGTTVPSGVVSVLSYASTPIYAIPYANYVFDHWSAAGDATIASSTSASTTVILVDVNDTVTANFKYSTERAGPDWGGRAWDRSKPDFRQANPSTGIIVKMSTNPRDGERITEEQQYQE